MVLTLAGPIWGAANLVCVEIILVRGRVVINKAEEDGNVTAATSHNLTKTFNLSEIQLYHIFIPQLALISYLPVSVYVGCRS